MSELECGQCLQLNDLLRNFLPRPVSLEDQLLPGTFEFAIHTLVKTRLDTAGFDQKYRNDETKRTAYDPKILLLGYARGLISYWKIDG